MESKSWLLKSVDLFEEGDMTSLSAVEQDPRYVQVGKKDWWAAREDPIFEEADTTYD